MVDSIGFQTCLPNLTGLTGYLRVKYFLKIKDFRNCQGGKEATRSPPQPPPAPRIGGASAQEAASTSWESQC